MTEVAEQAGWVDAAGMPNERVSVDPVRPLELVDVVVELPLADLNAGICPRHGGVRPDHVKTLAELGGQWPPILVARRNHLIIDGLHRVAAAHSLGHATINARMFDGSPDEAYIAAIQSNVTHGLPLTLAERKEAARHILGVHPSWSDRRIASTCGLSPATLGSLRAQMWTESGVRPEDMVDERRTGRDGRSRPANTAAARKRVAEAISRAPELSLRKIGALVGSSPETVRSVRAELASQTGPDQTEWWRSDAALGSSHGGKQLVSWLSRVNVDDAGWSRFLASIPLSRVYDLASEARRRAASWNEFAEQLELKVRKGRT